MCIITQRYMPYLMKSKLFNITDQLTAQRLASPIPISLLFSVPSKFVLFVAISDYLFPLKGLHFLFVFPKD